MGYIRLSNLGKAYKRYSSKWSRIAEWIYPRRERHEKHWVLRGVDVEITPGESVGIVGRNGAGKSTLLKMIVGTTQPTEGSIEVSGRIAALLELGMGFHPDFTGRQNVYMAGQINGVSSEQITTLMQEIEDFADIGDYIDQPLRTYSSGMQVRLAFSVATAVLPDILIVDEALAVGDAAFQRKCFRRIEDFREGGGTLLLVTHDTETVKRFCDKALFLAEGMVKDFGPAKRVCDAYEKYLFGGSRQKNKASKPPTYLDPGLGHVAEVEYGTGDAVIEYCRLENIDGVEINVIPTGEIFYWKYRVRFTHEVSQVSFGMMIKTREGVCVYGTNASDQSGSSDFAAGDEIEVSFQLINCLAPGIYYLNAGVNSDANGTISFLHRKVDTRIFRIVSAGSRIITGLADLRAEPEIRFLEQA